MSNLSAPHRLDESTKSLIIWLDEHVRASIQPGGNLEYDRYELLLQIWAVVQNRVGFYRERSFALNDQTRLAFINVEHNMKLLKSLTESEE